MNEHEEKKNFGLPEPEEPKKETSQAGVVTAKTGGGEERSKEQTEALLPLVEAQAEQTPLAGVEAPQLEEAARKGGQAPHVKRGLQAADQATRERVARAGGRARHEARGLQAAGSDTRERVARAGGHAPHVKRGLQAADKATRERVARAGGQAPHRSRGVVGSAEPGHEKIAAYKSVRLPDESPRPSEPRGEEPHEGGGEHHQ